MRLTRIPFFLCLTFLASGLKSSGAEISSEQRELSEKYRNAVVVLKDNFSQEKANLYDRYADAVGRLQQEFQQAGDLKNALLAKSEATLAREDREYGKEEFPRIQPLRQTLVDQVERIEMTEAKELAGLAAKFEQVLEPLKEKLTKAGRLEEASEVDKRIIELRSEKTDLARISQSGESGMSRKLPPRITDSILGQAQPVTGEHRLTMGLYERIGQTILGVREGKGAPQNGAEILIPPGSIFREGKIFLDVAKFNAQESLFKEIAFSQNLHSEFRASGCLFDNCTFAKGGGWGSKVSSQWNFVDCVFLGDLFTEWRTRLTGVQISQCTFEKVQLEPWGYLEDGGAEAVDPWWYLERCHFRDCIVPVSVLLATRDCVFENTRIERDRFPIETRISISIYYQGLEPEIPDLGDMITIKAEPVEKLNGKWGAQVKYLLGREGLVFED